MAQRPKSNMAVWPLLLGVAAVIILAIVIARAVTATPAAADTATPANTLATGGSPTSDMDAKYQILTQEAVDRAILLLTPSPGVGTEKPTLNVTPDLGTTSEARRPAGAGTIISGSPPLFPSIAYQISADKWVEVKQGTTIEVFAGARRNPTDWQDISQGLVIVMEEGSTTQTDEYETTTKSGPVYIVDAMGERLILQTQDGTSLYFDVPSRQFVEGLSVTVTPAPNTATPVVPSSTPAPSAYPVSSEELATAQPTTGQQ